MNTYAIHTVSGRVLQVRYSARGPEDPGLRNELDRECIRQIMEMSPTEKVAWTGHAGIVPAAAFVRPGEGAHPWPEGATCWQCGDPLGPSGGVLCSVCHGGR